MRAVDELPIVHRLERVLLSLLLQHRIAQVDGQLTDVDEGVPVGHLFENDPFVKLSI
jgi:hypothetical protein